MADGGPSQVWPGQDEARALAVRYEASTREVVLALPHGASFRFPVDQAQGLRGASDADLAEVALTPGGYGLHWEALDADLGVAGLLAGRLGSASWMAALGAD